MEKVTIVGNRVLTYRLPINRLAPILFICESSGIERKNRANIRKHHLDFADAGKVFLRPVLVALDERSGADYPEDRWVGIGMLDERRIVVVIFTEPSEDVIRVISFRKALAYERKRYQEAFRDEFGSL